MTWLARPLHLLKPYSLNQKTIFTGVCEFTANSNYIAAGVGSFIGEMTVPVVNGKKGNPGSASFTSEMVFTAYANRFNGGGASFIGEMEITALNIGGGGAISIYDEHILVKSNVKKLNFTGADVIAKLGTTEDVDVFIPPPLYVSHFQTSDGTTTATVNNISTTNRYVSSPSGGEGLPFYTGGAIPWGGDGSTHACTRTSPLIWTPGLAAGNLILFENLASTFTVTLTNSTGVIETYTTPSITGNSVNTGVNITVTITNFAPNADKYQANVSVSVDIASILPSSGYFDCEISHNNVLVYTYTQ